METDERRRGGGERERDGKLCFIREGVKPTVGRNMKKEKKRGLKNKMWREVII